MKNYERVKGFLRVLSTFRRNFTPEETALSPKYQSDYKKAYRPGKS